MEFSEIQSVKQRFGIIGITPGLNNAIDKAVQVAPTDLSILIQGESGVGKENFPQIIHQYSHRKHNTYIAVNCGAIPEGTIDSELFGHVKGAFTSASSDRKGFFEEADGGTIFLDEVGELPLSTQVRLLRVLESGEYLRVGSSKVMKTNVRVVAATNVNMLEAIREGKFREDLYYRLNAVPIHIPALRDRKEDIPLLFRKFASDFSEKYRMPIIKLDAAAQNLLTNYYWRGNIRQLKNVVEQISVIEENRDITPERLESYLPANESAFLPAVINNTNDGQYDHKTFNNEREILYQVLFDMKKDMAEMKKVVHDLMNGNISSMNSHKSPNVPTSSKKDIPEFDIMPTTYNIGHSSNDSHIPNGDIITRDISRFVSPNNITNHHNNVEDTIEYVEESLSLIDAEKEMIIKALERHNGKRKYAAQDLHISERTLYRKIKEYGLD